MGKSDHVKRTDKINGRNVRARRGPFYPEPHGGSVDFGSLQPICPSVSFVGASLWCVLLSRSPDGMRALGSELVHRTEGHGVGGNFMKSVMTFVSQACSCSSLCIYTDNTLPCTMFMVLILYHGHIIEFSLR